MGWQRSGDDQALHVIKRVDQIEHLLLVSGVNGGTGVHHIELVFLSVQEHVHARNAVGPNGMNVNALCLGALDDKATGEAGEKSEDSRILTKMIQRKGNVQTLTVWAIHGVARARDAIGLQAIARDVVIDSGIGGKGVDHDVSFDMAHKAKLLWKPLSAYQIEATRKPCPQRNKHD